MTADIADVVTLKIEMLTTLQGLSSDVVVDVPSKTHHDMGGLAQGGQGKGLSRTTSEVKMRSCSHASHTRRTSPKLPQACSFLSFRQHQPASNVFLQLPYREREHELHGVDVGHGDGLITLVPSRCRKVTG